MAKSSKFQKFEMETVSRSDIKGAEYNPRVISNDAKKRLKSMLAKHGLVQPLVWNRRTGNLVAGHQRLAALDALEKTEDYTLLVSVIDVDEREEKILNVQLNNPSMQGEWDLDKLFQLSEDSGINPDEMGFSEGDAAVLFGSDTALEELMTDNEEVTDAKNTLRDIKQHRAESMAKLQKEQSADFYFTVVCESDDQKRALLKKLNIPEFEAFVNGRQIAAALGV